jgi:hypothetical protein
MPWAPQDARSHNKVATGKRAEQWAATANSVLEETGDEGRAIATANAAIERLKKALGKK